MTGHYSEFDYLISDSDEDHYAYRAEDRSQRTADRVVEASERLGLARVTK